MSKSTSDLRAAELLSKSLSANLTSEERQLLADHESTSSEGKSFSKLSALINRSVTNVSHADAPEAEEGLSEVAKERLRRSVRQATKGSSLSHDTFYFERSSDVQRVAENETLYATSGTPTVQDEVEERSAVARFTLIEQIGEGGLGRVWLARDERLKRNVAIKEMLPSTTDSAKLADRFRREAEITGHLEHPNVVPLYLSGVNRQTQQPFYAMRFLGKRTLAEAIREYHARSDLHGSDSALHLHRLLNAFVDVCQAIAYAHSRGVIHRDLKPDNVALDNFGQVLVLDWGLAKLDGDGELATRLALSGGNVIADSQFNHTVAGDVVGTPLYMAPEQAAGKMDQIDSRTDVYGLGAILFAILTGSAPHENSNKSDGGTLQVRQFLDSIASSDTPLARNINAHVPRDLEAICARAMAREKFARHADATELANEVEGWIAGKREKEARYDVMRMSASDLRSRLCVQIRQLASSAQFMVELPPIQGLLESVGKDADEFATWRERLTTILLAVARSKPNVSGLSYSQYEDDRILELARIERSLHDISNIRSLPQSRLRKGVANTFHKIVMQQFPGEGEIDFDCTTAGSVRIVCGVPVFDAQTEEPFGLVCAEAEIGNLVRPELELINTEQTVYLVDMQDGILYAHHAGAGKKGLPANEVIDSWDDIASSLRDEDEYLDPNREIYATQLSLPNRRGGIRIVFQAKH